MEGLPDWLLDPSFIWFIIGLVFLLLELTAPGLVIFFFGVGAWLVALVCIIIEPSVAIQVLLFLVFSILTLFLLRNKLKIILFSHKPGSNGFEDGMDDYRGKKVVVTREIKVDSKGKVEFNGTNWDAESDVPVAEGEIVVIVDKNNITFKVVPI